MSATSQPSAGGSPAVAGTTPPSPPASAHPVLPAPPSLLSPPPSLLSSPEADLQSASVAAAAATAALYAAEPSWHDSPSAGSQA